MPASLEQQLDRIEKLARGSILQRFLKNPFRYGWAIGYWRLVYPMRKKGKYAQAATFFGASMQLVLPSATEIYLFGAKTHDSEIRLARFLMKNLKQGQHFCDVGAHFGYFSLLASQLVGKKGKVTAFEASRSTFEILSKNTAAYPNIQAVHRAASDEDKALVFHEFPALFSEYNSLVLPKSAQAGWMKNNPPQRIEVKGQRLDNFFGVHDPVVRTNPPGHLPQIIKIDVEGAEPQVLRGMKALLTMHTPVLIMEYLIGEGQNEAHRQAVSFAQQLGYQLCRIGKGGDMVPCADLEAAMRADGLDSDNIVLRKLGKH